MPSDVQSLLVETIATIASHASTPELRNQYFTSLSNSIEVYVFISYSNSKSRLSSLLTRADFMAIYKQQSFMEKVVDVLEMYDGLCMAADESNSAPVFEACSKHFASFVKLLDMYHNFPEFELYILQIFSHLAAHLVCFLSIVYNTIQSFEGLSPTQRELFYSNITNLLTIYAKNESSRSRVASKENEEELFEDLSCILSMLANLMTGEYEGLGALYA